MKTKVTQLLAVLLLASIAPVRADAPAELKHFPAAKDGMERFVILLPNKERGEEDAFRVELIPGREMMTDGVNLFHLGAAIESRDLEGWGYNFYIVTGPGEAAGTLMAVPDGTPQVKKFVTGQSLMILYNSRLPIVIYAPKGMEIRYRIWKAPADFVAADKG
jgi:ecotin